MSNYVVSNHIARERYQAAREALESYRGAWTACIWGLVLFFPAVFVLMLIGFSYEGAVVTLMFAGVCVWLHFQHRANQVEELKPFPCLKCIGDDDLAVTKITNPWVCAFCAKSHPPFNSLPWRSTLVDPCKNENCNARQHSVLCWRCDELIIWDDDAYRRDQKKSAYHPNYTPLLEAEAPKTEDRPPKPIDEDLR